MASICRWRLEQRSTSSRRRERFVTWPHGDPNAVVARVLASGAYGSTPRTTAGRPHATLLGDVWDWAWHYVLGPLFRPLAHALVSSRGAGTVVGFALVAAALLAFGYVVFRLIVAFVRDPRAVRPAGDGSLALGIERSARDWRAFARAAAARGEYGRAIAALFSAAVAELDERALVTFDASRTPGEYRRLVRRARAAAQPPFDELAERFVRAMYAPETPAPAEYEAAERALAALEPALST